METKSVNFPCARPLRWWPDAQLRRLELAMQVALDAWSRDWGVQHACDVRCSLAAQASVAAGAWERLAQKEDGDCANHVWWAVAGADSCRDAVKVMAGLVFGEPSGLPVREGPSDMAREAGCAMWADLWRCIGAPLQVRIPAEIQTSARTDAAAPGRAPFRPWSGAIVVSLQWSRYELQVLLASELAEGIFAKPTNADASANARPLVPVWNAIAPASTTVRAELAPVELTLGSLQALRVGDVIELAHPLSQPLAAKTIDGQLLCEAFLGRVGERRAIELLMPAASAQTI